MFIGEIRARLHTPYIAEQRWQRISILASKFAGLLFNVDTWKLSLERACGGEEKSGHIMASGPMDPRTYTV